MPQDNQKVEILEECVISKETRDIAAKVAGFTAGSGTALSAKIPINNVALKAVTKLNVGMLVDLAVEKTVHAIANAEEVRCTVVKNDERKQQAEREAQTQKILEKRKEAAKAEQKKNEEARAQARLTQVSSQLQQSMERTRQDNTRRAEAEASQRRQDEQRREAEKARDARRAQEDRDRQKRAEDDRKRTAEREASERKRREDEQRRQNELREAERKRQEQAERERRAADDRRKTEQDASRRRDEERSRQMLFSHNRFSSHPAPHSASATMRDQVNKCQSFGGGSYKVTGGRSRL